MQEKYAPRGNTTGTFNRTGNPEPFKHSVRLESSAKLGQVKNMKELQKLTSLLGLYITSALFIYKGEIHKLSRHMNPDKKLGGFVENTAYAAPTALIEKDALVLEKARVENEARIQENAIIAGEAKIRDTAVVKGSVQVFDKVQVSGHRVLRGSEWFYGSAVLATAPIGSDRLWAGDQTPHSKYDL